MPGLIILDACVSLLIVTGYANKSYIAKHKRLQGYDEVDFTIVCNIIARSDGVIFTPNALSETSGLARYIADPIRSELSMTLKTLIQNADERFVPSRVAVQRSEYVRLGLTDAVLLEVARCGATLLTVDLMLYLAALRAGLNAANYNHIKEQRADFR